MSAKLVDELIPVDRILQRWAVSVGDGLHDQPWAEVPVSKVSILDDQMAIVVDQLVLRSEPTTRKLVELWYRTPMPKEAIARKIHVEPDVVYVRWNSALYYFRDRFSQSPLTGLRKLVAADVETKRRYVYKQMMDWVMHPKSSKKAPEPA